MIQTNFNHIVDGLRTFLPICDLRRAQLDIFEELLSKSDQNVTKGFFNLATGFGKTRMMTVLTESFLLQNPTGKVVVVVPTTALVKDENGDGMIKRFQDFHQMYHHEPLSIGAFYTYSKDTKSDIIVTTYSSLNTLAKEINPKEVGLLLLDEAHHSLSEKRIEAIKEFSNACCYGLTATPAYSSDKSLETLLGSVISEMNTVQAVKDGLLAPCKNILLSSKIKVDLSAVSKTSQGEYQQHELEKILSQALMAYQSEGTAQNWQNVHELIANEIAVFYRNYVDETLGQVQGKKCMINCRSQVEAKLQARALNKLFGKTVANTWTTDTKDKTILNKFVNGDLPVLCQVGKLSEGFDMPELDMCINYPTCSKVVEAQRGGRVLRLNPENENKFALIVDVVFSHPDFDNPILSSHANGQVLYRDITNASVIISEKKDNASQSNKKTQEREKNTNKKPSLEAFDIFSDIEELITLENEALAQLSEQNFPLKRDGMLIISDLTKIFKKDRYFFSNILEKCYQKGVTFNADGQEYPLVEKVKSWSHITLALNEHPKAFKKFKEILATKGVRSDVLQKREGMLSGKDLAPLLNISDKLCLNILEEFYYKGCTFGVDGVEYPLVERVKSKSHLILALNEHPNAFNKVKNILLQRWGAKKREGMKVATELAKLFVRSHKKITDILEKCYQKGFSFNADGKEYPLVEKVKSWSCITLALHEHPKALEKFKEFLETEGVKVDILAKREGMKTRQDLGRLLNRGEKFFLKFLEQFYQEKQTFEFDGIKYPLVEKVMNFSSVIFALHEHPKALEKFKQLLVQEGIVLEKRTNTRPAPQGQKITDQRKLPTQNTSRGAKEK